MKTTYAHYARRLTLALLLPLILLSVGCQDGTDTIVGPESEVEEAPAIFTITSKQVSVSSTRLEGTFEALGFIKDQGTVQEVHNAPESLHQQTSIYGVKTLSSAKGTITIEFYASLSPTGPNTLQASGGFRIKQGSGAYEGLQGSGEIDREMAANATPAEIARVLTGEVRYVR